MIHYRVDLVPRERQALIDSIGIRIGSGDMADDIYFQNLIYKLRSAEVINKVRRADNGKD
jgi:hypothetical protein